AGQLRPKVPGVGRRCAETAVPRLPYVLVHELRQFGPVRPIQKARAHRAGAGACGEERGPQRVDHRPAAKVLADSQLQPAQTHTGRLLRDKARPQPAVEGMTAGRPVCRRPPAGLPGQNPHGRSTPPERPPPPSRSRRRPVRAATIARATGGGTTRASSSSVAWCRTRISLPKTSISRSRVRGRTPGTYSSGTW